jgi:glycosyltransferase involved in cell wall biosynthesis
MRKLLIVTYSYAPMLNARAFRWTALAEHLVRASWQVDVVASWQPDAPATEIRNGVQVHRAGWRWAERARKPAAGPSGDGRPSLARRMWRQVYWPDFASSWYWPARAAASELLRDKRHDAMVSVSPAFTAVIAAQSARNAAHRCRWVVDIGDPFSLQEHLPPNNVALYSRLNRRVEARVLRHASSIAVTTQRTAQRYAEAFPHAATKLHVIPPMLSIPEPAHRTRSDGAIRLVYIGRLYRGLREPDFLLRLFGELCRLQPGARYELHLLGEMREFDALLSDWTARLEGRLVLRGVQPRDVAAAAVAGADVLVNVGNESADQLPSKLVEYAAAGKPILNIARQQDASAEFLGGYPDALTLLDAGPPTAEQIQALAAFVRSLPRALSPEERERWIAPYRLPSIARRYEALLV